MTERSKYTVAYDFIRQETAEYSNVHEMKLPQFSRGQCARFCEIIGPAFGMTHEEFVFKIADYSDKKEAA